jgi:hypothetical protein
VKVRRYTFSLILYGEEKTILAIAFYYPSRTSEPRLSSFQRARASTVPQISRRHLAGGPVARGRPPLCPRVDCRGTRTSAQQTAVEKKSRKNSKFNTKMLINKCMCVRRVYTLSTKHCYPLSAPFCICPAFLFVHTL